jgi:hypothetical protein
MNAPARTMEIPSDMETCATADLTATMGVFMKCCVQMLSPDEIDLARLRITDACGDAELVVGDWNCNQCDL